MTTIRAWTIAASLAWAAGGCTSKLSQCDDLAAAIERHGKAMTRVDSRELEDARPQGAAIADAAAAIGGLELADEGVASFAREYAALLHEAAGVVDAAAAAATARERDQIHHAIRSFDALAAREVELVGELNAYCQAGS